MGAMARKRPGRKRTPSKGLQRKTPVWTKAFLAAFRETGVVRAACDAAGVAKSVVYLRKHSDKKFAEQWEEAYGDAADLLELEVKRRAHDGVDEPVIHKGELMGIWVDDDGHVVTENTPNARKIPLTIKKYSDVLLMFRLKAMRPEQYRDNFKVEHAGDPKNPVKHEHTHVTDRIEQLAGAFTGAADRAGESNLSSHNPRKPVDS